METPHTKRNQWRATAIALAVLTVALAASLFVTSAPADARPSESRVVMQTDTGDEDADVEMDPYTWFCLVNKDAKDFAACEAGQPPANDAAATARLATPDQKNRGLDVPGNWLCPAGTTAVAFDQPIYDDETGLWVIGYETVWYCLDLSGGPAG